MIIQTIGVTAYFIGKTLSTEHAPFLVDWLNIIGVIFMPISMVTGQISILLFKNGSVTPYPLGMEELYHTIIFTVTFLIISVSSFMLIKNRKQL